MSVNVALMLAWTICPDVPLYEQAMLMVASVAAARDPVMVDVLPPVQLTEAVPETATEPLRVTVEMP